MPDDSRVLVLVTIVLWIGATLLLAELRWFRRTPLDQRLRPFAGPALSRRQRSVSDIRTVVTPIFERAGEQLARLFGAREDLATRLRRANLDIDPTSFRLRQFGWAGGALAIALLAVLAIRPPAPVTLIFLAGSPLLAFLLLEQQVANAASARSARIFAELPVMSEQLAMLLGAGFSLGSALNRLAERGGGVISEDLVQVRDRMRHGLTAAAALREWAGLANVPELHRLVGVLALSSETSDLGRLVSDEAKSIRRESQRRLAETIDRRAQQVWVPVTVATLVPGVIFLTIPFLQALRLFSAG